MSAKNKVIFLDRDGTINKDYGYVKDPNKLELLKGAVEGLLLFRDLGFKLIVITNQSGIGRDYYTLDDYHAVTDKLNEKLKEHSIILDDCYYCPHSPESNCACRKPSTGMLDKAIKKWNVDLDNSFFIGDKQSDIQAGINIGVTTLLISDTDDKSFSQNYTIRNLTDAACLIRDITAPSMS